MIGFLAAAVTGIVTSYARATVREGYEPVRNAHWPPLAVTATALPLSIAYLVLRIVAFHKEPLDTIFFGCSTGMLLAALLLAFYDPVAAGGRHRREPLHELTIRPDITHDDGPI